MVMGDEDDDGKSCRILTKQWILGEIIYSVLEKDIIFLPYTIFGAVYRGFVHSAITIKGRSIRS